MMLIVEEPVVQFRSLKSLLYDADVSLSATAVAASAWSNYFDSLIDRRISRFFNKYMHINVPFLSSHPDYFAFGITLILTSKYTN